MGRVENEVVALPFRGSESSISGCQRRASDEGDHRAATLTTTVTIMEYRCSTCGETHYDLPHIGLEYPDYYFGVPEEEQASRIKLTSDTSIIDDQDFFIRGVIEIPVHDYSPNIWIRRLGVTRTFILISKILIQTRLVPSSAGCLTI